MAYYRKSGFKAPSRRRRTSTRGRSSSYGGKRRRSTGGKRAGRSSQTIRIVIEQPNQSSAGRVETLGQMVAKPTNKNSKF